MSDDPVLDIDMIDAQIDSTLKRVDEHAATSSDHLVSMLREVDQRLQRDPPDIHGARVSLTGARIIASLRAMATEADQPEQEVGQ